MIVLSMILLPGAAGSSSNSGFEQALDDLTGEPALRRCVVRHLRVGGHSRVHLRALVRDVQVMGFVDAHEVEVHLRRGEHRLQRHDRRRVTSNGLRGDLHLRSQDQREVFVVSLVVAQIPIGRALWRDVRHLQRADLVYVRQGEVLQCN